MSSQKTRYILKIHKDTQPRNRGHGAHLLFENDLPWNCCFGSRRSKQRCWLENDNFVCIRGCNSTRIDRAIQTRDLNVIMAHTRDDLNSLKT